MKSFILTVLVTIASVGQVCAKDMSARERECLGNITKESQSILEQVETIHASYEKEVEMEKLSATEAGPYKAKDFLDYTIRKMHEDIKMQFSSYPLAYTTQLGAMNIANERECFSVNLNRDGQELVKNFEDQWKKAIQKLIENKKFIELMGNDEYDQLTNPASRH